MIKDDETMEDLIKEISNIFRTKLGLGREISLVQAKRLTMTRVEVNGFPPVLMSFEHQHDRDAVMSKMGSLDKQSGGVVCACAVLLILPRVHLKFVRSLRICPALRGFSGEN